MIEIVKDRIGPEAFRQDRREILKGLSRFAVLGLSGCCSLKPQPLPEIDDAVKADRMLVPFLQPTKHVNKSKPYTYCIDVHAHFFNASDVNVKDYVEGPVARKMPSAMLQQLTRDMAGVIDALAAFAPKAAREYDQLIRDSVRYKELSLRAEDIAKELEDRITQHRRNLAEALHQEMVRRNLDKKYMELQKRQFRRSAVPKALDTFSPELVYLGIDPLERHGQREKLITSDTYITAEFDVSGILEFVGHMLSPRWINLIDYQGAYTVNDGAFGIDCVFASLVDFDYWLDCPPRSAREDQVKLHSLMSMLSGGYMLPLVSYNPWTDMKKDDASFELMQKAISNYGFIGVKIYPANGFFPYGNADNPVQTKQRRPEDLEELDNKLKEVWDWCAAKRIPIMAHAGESMGSDDGADSFGGPVGWRAFSKLFSESGRNPPLVNLGHFGGDAPSQMHPDNRWPKEFGEIMLEPGGEGYYGDLGYWSTLQNCEDGQNACALAKKRIKAALTASQNKATGRIMYGSDWLMLSQETNWQEYPVRVAEELNSILPMDRFFYKNAVEAFGLGKGGVHRSRIIESLEKYPGGVPAWLSEA